MEKEERNLTKQELHKIISKIPQVSLVKPCPMPVNTRIVIRIKRGDLVQYAKSKSWGVNKVRADQTSVVKGRTRSPE